MEESSNNMDASEKKQDEPTASLPDVAARFPTEMLPHAAREYVQAAARSLACAPDYVGAAFLAAAATAIGTTRQIEIKPDWHEQAHLYVVLVGEPGDGKSPALDKAFAPLVEHDDRLEAENRAKWAEYVADEGNEKRDESENKNAAHPPVPHHVYTTNVTVEALTDLLANNNRGVMLYADETSGWVSGMNQYKNGRGSDRQFYLERWSGKTIKQARKGTRLIVKNPFLCVVGGIQPGMLDTLWLPIRSTQGYRDDGFTHRILWAYPETRVAKFNPEGIPQGAKEAYSALFERLWHLQPSVSWKGTLVPKTVSFRQGCVNPNSWD